MLVNQKRLNQYIFSTNKRHEEVDRIRHKFRVRGHWWFDAGLMGLYFVATDQTRRLLREDRDLEQESRWPDVEVTLEADGIVLEAPDDRMKEFLEDCYEVIAALWWNRSSSTQIQKRELVYYDREKQELECRPKRSPTPIPALFTGGSSWRVDGEPFDSLSEELKKRVSTYLAENEKSLWGKKKILCYGQPVCHPVIEIFPTRELKKTCSVCGEMSVCDKVSQTSFPFFSSETATFSFNSELGPADDICWECQMLGKFAVHAALYKKQHDTTHVIQLSSGDLETLLFCHDRFGLISPLRGVFDGEDEEQIYYFCNYHCEDPFLKKAALPYEVLFEFCVAAYDTVMENKRKRMSEETDDELDEETVRNVSALNVVMISFDEKGNTFITKELVSYTDTTYIFRLIEYIKRSIRREAPEEIQKDASKFLGLLFRDFALPNPQKPFDPLNGMERNRIFRSVFAKKSILHAVERFVFRKSLKAAYPRLDRILFFTKLYELAIHRRDTEDKEGTKMTKDQIKLASNLGRQIVGAAKEALMKEGKPDALKAIKGALFTLRKTRTATDFLEQLNRLQFRYGFVVSKEIAAGVLTEENVPFEDFKAYCMISALNHYNGVMFPFAKTDDTGENPDSTRGGDES